jgi:surface protein
MFRDASSFNGVLSGWNVSSVTDMKDMFRYATSFNADISGWPLYHTCGNTITAWVETALTDEIKDNMTKQGNCPVTLTPVTCPALRCCTCKYMFNEGVKNWIDKNMVCPHCRSGWSDRVVIINPVAPYKYGLLFCISLLVIYTLWN